MNMAASTCMIRTFFIHIKFYIAMYHESPVNDVLPFAFACDGCYL
jgi:hypothetical protein